MWHTFVPPLQPVQLNRIKTVQQEEEKVLHNSTKMIKD